MTIASCLYDEKEDEPDRWDGVLWYACVRSMKFRCNLSKKRSNGAVANDGKSLLALHIM